ncbi:PilZ domain-containing protein [Pimelobacter simplex]|uniref:PilZ domain-containing protein n=2 Tax=Nocardioides simplex TaxID=2045 RepID=A0A7J5DYY1_NOCSI|nr:PilZ domain-containing protein [Pimelobacter simplex]
MVMAPPELHPAVLQSVALTVRPTSGAPLALQTKVLDLEPQPDGSTTLVVAPPPGLDPREHHFDATLAWTYPLGRMECTVRTRPGRRAYGDVWLVCASAPATRLQERAYFRARLTVPVLLTWTDETEDSDAPEDTTDSDATEEQPEPVELHGLVVDLSEGGLLATVPSRPPALGTRVEVTVRVDGENLSQPATVVRHVAFASGGHGVAVAFAEPRRHGDRLRAVVFAVERRRRSRT